MSDSGEGLEPSPLSSHDPTKREVADMARKLQKNVYVDGVLHLAGSSPDKDVADQITNPKAWGGLARVEPATTEEPPVKPPTKAELLAAIEKRNEGREDDARIVPASEKNADLEAALKADDEKSA